MKYLKLQDGAQMAYMDKGIDRSNPPIVFLHGFPADHSMWKNQIDELSVRRRVIVPDLRGFGQSPLGEGPHPMETHVDDVLFLLDALGVSHAVLVGLSMGGYVALRALEKTPDRFSKIVLMDTQSPADSDGAKLKRHEAMENIRSKGARAFAEKFAEGAFAPDTWRTRPPWVESFVTGIAALPAANLRAGLFSLLSRTDTTSILSRIRVPTLGIVGEHDRITPPDVMRAMTGQIAGGMLSIIPKAGHFPPLENPDALNPILEEFIAP